MRYAFVTDVLPRPGSAGHLAFNHAIISWLRGLGHEVVVLLTGARLGAPVERYDFAPVAGAHVLGARNYLAARSPGSIAGILARAAVRQFPNGLATRIRGTRHGADTVLGAFCTKTDLRWCARYIARTRPDTVLIDTIFRAGLLAEPELAGVNSVIVAHDVFHRRHLALSAAGYRVRPQRLTREDEAGWLAQARHIAAIQPEEAELLTAMCPAQNVFATPMPAIPAPPPPGQMRLRRRLVFVGSATLPNLDGLRWFFTAVWPQLEPQGVTLDLVGDCGAALPRLPPDVSHLGRIDDLATVLHRAALAIAPLRVGSGLKIKLLDYARHGLFTVATPPSLEGFAPDPLAPFIPAASAEAFAEIILRQLSAPREAEAALAYVTRHYGIATSFKGLAQALNA
jgi:hypothetical protein